MKLFRLIANEIRAAMKSRFFIGVLLVVPIVLGLFMGYTFTWKRVPQRIPVAVWNRDNQIHSREFLRYLDSMQAFELTYFVTDMEAGKELFVSGKVRGFLVIPKDFSTDIRKGRVSRVVFYQDFNYLLPGRTLAKAISKVESFEQEKWYKRFFEDKGLSGAGAEFLKNPIRIEYRKLFNPTMEYTQFILPGIFMAFLFQILFIVGCYSMFTNKHGYEESSSWSFLVSKTVSFMVLGLIPFLILYVFCFWLFDLAMGSILLVLCFYLLFALATLFMGMLIGTIFREPVMAMEVIIGLGALAFTFSGFTWPRLMFPVFFDYAVVIFPITSFLEQSSKIWYETGYWLNPWPLVILIGVYFIPLFFLNRKRSF